MSAYYCHCVHVCVCVCLQLKEKVAEKFNLVLEQICLIHSGKILCDSEELTGCGIIDETVVHMVVKSACAQVCNGGSCHN